MDLSLLAIFHAELSSLLATLKRHTYSARFFSDAGPPPHLMEACLSVRREIFLADPKQEKQ